MAPPSQHRAVRRAVPAEARDNRRSWFSHGLVALAISALGLAAAGSLALTSNAEDTEDRPQTPVTLAPVLPGSSPTASAAPVDPTDHDPALAAFARRDRTSDTAPTRSVGVRTALTMEQAAQRSEDLAKTADAVTRTARTESSNARQEALSAAEQARQVRSAQLAAEKLRRAVAARLAAEAERRAAEQRQAEEQLAEQQQAEERRAEQQQADQQQADQQQADRQQAQQPQAQQQQSAPRPARQRARTEAPESPARTVPSGGGGSSPVPGAVIGSHFGEYGSWSRYHTGLDFRAAYGTPIRAVRTGVVLFAGNSGHWAGNYVAIRHADGKTTMSSHMSSMAVRTGQTVRAGQVIGYVGQTGRAFGAHLHFELYPVGVRYGDVYRAINPQPWLSANGVRTR